MKKFINIVSVMVALAVTSMAAPMTMLTVPDAQPLLDSSDPFGFGYTMTLNGVTLAWTNQPTAYISDTNAVNRQTTITVNGQPALLTTNPVFTISGASPVTVRVNEQTGSTSSNMAFSVTAAGIGALTNEATTLAQAAERGGFSGTETIMPLSLFCGIPSFYGSTVSDVGVKTLSPSGVQASLSTDDGLVLLTPNAFTWEIKGDTLDYTRTDIPSQKSSWSFAHGIGSFVVAAISDIPVALTNAGVWQAIEDAQSTADGAVGTANNAAASVAGKLDRSGGTATNLAVQGTLTVGGERVLTTNQFAQVCSQQCVRAWMPMYSGAYGYLDIPVASNSTTHVMGAPLGSFVVRLIFGFGATNSVYTPFTIFCDDSSGDPRNSHSYIATTTDVIRTTYYNLTNSPGWIVRDNPSNFRGIRRNISFYTRGVPANTRVFPVWSPLTPWEAALPSNTVWYVNDTF